MKIANISEQEAAMYCMKERMAELEKENDMKFNDVFKVGFTVGFLDCMEYLADELEEFKKGLEDGEALKYKPDIEDKLKSNYQKIKNMKIEEMAEFLYVKLSKKGHKKTLEWLQEESEE